MEWMLMPLKRYADFQGRSRRKEYWMYFLLVFGVTTVFQILTGVLGSFGASIDPETGIVTPGKGAFIVFLVMVLFFVGTIVPSIAVVVRRLHDQDKSGWLALLSFIPIVGGIILLVFMCLPGTTGANQFGPDPINGGSADLKQTFQ
jgi:uncharacterized membrane protein YhaH (DUF805 family)